MTETAHDLGAIFDEHVAQEFVAKDVAATMATMAAEPFVNHVPTMMGGVGAAGWRTSTTSTSSGTGQPTRRSFRCVALWVPTGSSTR